MGAEPLMRITSKLSLPVSYAVEWMQGYRPLPGADAWQYFECGIGSLYTEAEAIQLLARHRALEAQAAIEDPEIPGEVHDWLTSRGWQAPK